MSNNIFELIELKSSQLCRLGINNFNFVKYKQAMKKNRGKFSRIICISMRIFVVRMREYWNICITIEMRYSWWVLIVYCKYRFNFPLIKTSKLQFHVKNCLNSKKIRYLAFSIKIQSLCHEKFYLYINFINKISDISYCV